jgi:phosphoribosylaminoimidazole (AIR) synthetase
VLVVDAADADKALDILQTEGETAMRVGEIIPASGTPSVEITN